jgi:hypothetical protein
LAPELRSWVAVAAGDRFKIKDAKLAELRREHDIGALRAPFGDKVGEKPPSRGPQGVVAGQGLRLKSSTRRALELHVPSRQRATSYLDVCVDPRRFERAPILRPPTLRTTLPEA